ncbi:hypothetical protein PFISCL1PPCAC_3268, partial [Pristionchus fissidentatus]
MDANCEYAEELYDLTSLRVLQWIYIITSIASIFLVVYTARHYLHMSIFENVTKELIIALYVLIAIHSVSLALVQGSQLFYRYTALTKCEAQSPKMWCIFRYIAVVIIWSFAILHIGITLQHLLSSFLFGVRIQKIVSRMTIIISFLFSLVCGILAFYQESLEGRTAYCAGFTVHSERILMFNLYFVLILDILNTLASLLLWKHNRQKLLAEQSYDLSRSFHRRQNVYAMEQFLPIAALNSTFYVVFFLTVYFSQALKSRMSPGWYLFTSVVASVQPYYCLLCPLILLVLIRRGRFKRFAHVHSMVHPVKTPNEVSY